MRFDDFHHFSHDHEIGGVGILIPCFCSMCTLPIPKGLDCYWCYRCRFYVHIECSELPEHIDHSLHSLHSLKLAKRSLNHSCRCYYCDKPFQSDEYVYACDHQSCSDFYMHMTCAMIPLPTITSNELDHGVVQFSCHQQPMILVDHSDKREAKCFGCQLNWSGSAYSCISKKCENFLHKSCAELPWKIQHPFHSSHSLILQITKEIKKETKEAKLKILGDSRWDWLDTESMDHQSKETSSESTLKEIVDMLTEQEKEMLIDPFAFNDPIRKVFRKNVYNEHRNFNSRFDRKGSIEDIDRIKQFFHFKAQETSFEYLDDFEMFLRELRYFTPEEGLLKLDDKYLRQKIEDVDSFMVPKTLAPILKATFHKYGNDFVGKGNLTPAMKSITSTLLCIVIDEMCRTKVEDITKDDLRHWYFYLTGIQETTGFVLARFVDSFEEILEAFLGFEAIRYEKGIREELDHEMAMLEARMKRLKENREKLKRDTSDMSDYMRTCAKRASEWKHRSWGDKWF